MSDVLHLVLADAPSVEQASNAAASDAAASDAVAPTAEQRGAIDARGGNLTLSAGAGSGKTRVLVDRFVALAEEGVSPTAILAVTFTEKAAAEMKER
ncbi:MAG: UvrD-helicase domain-containing protein, partial [Gemmatimonadota bacterium]|nr:UvrD-helicase domain-containing protein [Gemmatimonadota bacterium]